MPIKRMTVLNIWVQGLLLLCVGGLNAQSRADRITPKNIINIVLDDADYSDFGFNNFASSAESVGTFWLRKLSKLVI